MTRVRLYLSHDSGLNWLMAYEFGRVDDGQPPDVWTEVGESFGFLHEAPGGRVVGFKVTEFSAFDPEHPEVDEIWSEPRFDAPALGLLNASACEIVLAARMYFRGEDSVNRILFAAATSLSGVEAVDAWRRCLEAGDAMAHFALGYTLLELGATSEAYRHLRHYTEIAPYGAWNWCWYGQAAQALGEPIEARRAYRRAAELTADGDVETDAPERLAAMNAAAAATPGDDPLGPPDAEPAGSRVVLWGDELPDIGRRRVEALSPQAAVGMTAGAKKKSYSHIDPNEDAVAAVDLDGVTLIVCADGHNGMASTRAAVGAVLDQWNPLPSPSTIDDAELIRLWESANARVQVAAATSGQHESRTTLVVAVIAEGVVRWAAMGDSLLAIVRDETVTYLSQPKSHFVGWPMTAEEIAARLPRGTAALEADAWVIAATDGLTDFVSGLSATLIEAAGPDTGASRVVERLIDAACRGGAGDNVAVVAVRGEGVQTPPELERPSVEMRTRGCLFGGAVGDALGAAIEFDSIERIRKRFGANGVTDYEIAYGLRGAITDDTQMSLFTAEGLIRAYVRGTLKGLCHPPTVVDHAYARWLLTQGEQSSRWDTAAFDGWLLTKRNLYAVRAPGNTCLSALRATRMGTVDEPLNDSKGCGGVMRVAPVGMLGRNFPGDRFELARDIAALTHGHPSGYLTAGTLAVVIDALIWADASLDRALDLAIERLSREPRSAETIEAVSAARALAASGAAPSPEVIARLGEGWVAEEALAIAIYCALVARDFEHGVLLAVNHSGDSDSTGAITGNILGAIHGYGGIHARWVHNADIHWIESLCREWNVLFVREDEVDLEADQTWWDRYPGW